MSFTGFRTNRGVDRRAVRLAIGGAVALAVVLVALGYAGLDPAVLLDDPLAAAGVAYTRPWVGMLSMVGTLVWTVAAGAWLLTAFVRADASAAERRFVLCTAGLVTLLAVDDGLLLHDHVIPHALGTHVAEKAIIAMHGLAIAAWSVVFLDWLRRLHPFALLLAGVGMLGSVLLDAHLWGIRWIIVTEDALKLYAVGALLVWSMLACRDLLRSETPRVGSLG